MQRTDLGTGTGGAGGGGLLPLFLLRRLGSRRLGSLPCHLRRPDPLRWRDGETLARDGTRPRDWVENSKSGSHVRFEKFRLSPVFQPTFPSIPDVTSFFFWTTSRSEKLSCLPFPRILRRKEKKWECEREEN